MKPSSTTPLIPNHPLTPVTRILFGEGSGTVTAVLGSNASTGTLVGATLPAWGSDASGTYLAISNTSSGCGVTVPAGPAVNPVRAGGGAEAFSLVAIFDWSDTLAQDGNNGHALAWKDGDYGLGVRNSNFYGQWWGGTDGTNATWTTNGNVVAGRNTTVMTVSADAVQSLYNNGTLLGTGNQTTSSVGGYSATNPLTVGFTPTGQFVSGFGAVPANTASTAMKVRAVYLYPRALTAAEAQTLACDPYVFYQRSPATAVVPVATRNYWPKNNADTTISTSGGAANVRNTAVMLREATNLRLVYVGAGYYDDAASGPYTVSAAIDHDGTHRVTWNGSPTLTVTANGRFVSDPVVRSDGSLLVAPEGVVVGVNQHLAASVGIPSGYVTEGGSTYTGSPLYVPTPAAPNDGIDYNSADESLTGGITHSGLQFATSSIQLLGQLTGPRALPVVGLITDSIGAGQGDGQGATVGEGFAADACASLSAPYFSAGVPGDTAASWATTHTQRLAALVGAGCTQILVELGDNDIFGGATWQTAKANITAVCGTVYQQFGVKPVICTVNPRTNSTDNWTTTTNQTVQTPTYEAQRVLLNQDMRANFASYGAIACLDTAMPLQTAQDSGIYAAPSGVALCADGIHPSPAGHTLMMAVVQPQVSAWVTAAVPGTSPASTPTATGATLTANAGGGFAPLTYAWSGTGITFSNSAVANPTATVTVAGTYTASLTVTDSRGQKAAGNTTFTATSTMNVSPTAVPAGSPQAVTVYGSLLAGFFSYSGTSGASVSRTLPIYAGQTSFSLAVNASGTGTLIIQDSTGPSVTVNVVAAQPAAPTVVPISGGATATWQPSPGAASYQLLQNGTPVANVSSGSSLTATVVGLTNGTAYAFTLTATDAAGHVSSPAGPVTVTPAVQQLPSGSAFDATPSDTVDQPYYGTKLIAGGAGVVKVTLLGQSAPVLIPVAPGVPLTLSLARLYATGTTATAPFTVLP